ncbi:MAG: tRNA 2-thiouridine(34) synthase MnmA [Deltaproteobacteria bacterium]|jgi:tRNA-specific 2-thiouridylase|nr:tRNA 2-thiouridine(34) synthase MnmA [Deltaproteobacteria bacterium]
MRKAKAKVLAGLSGGVDSAVAAMLLVERGYAVTGVMMAVYGGEGGGAGNACYGPGEAEDMARAGEVAAVLGIPFHVINCVDDYEKQVLAYFKRSYLAGETPNPCLRCNQAVKFGLLPARARSLGLEAEFFATGHYARTVFSEKYGLTLLARGADRRRDQSYFLCRLKREQLASAIFPLGDLEKEAVRALAKKAGLPVHDLPDSQDFYAGRYQELLRMAPLEGAIVDSAGTELGRHQGYWNFTPGQRRGLGLTTAEPVYVLRVDPRRNQVVVGSRQAALSASCLIAEPHFFVSPARADAALRVKIRSAQEPVPVTVTEENGRFRLFFDSPQPAPAPGQAAVLYAEDVVLGSGIIQ